jgi:hypothetical protein
MEARHWKQQVNAEGAMSLFNDMLRRLEIKEPTALPDLRQGPALIVLSDYGRQHPSVSFESLSFLIADLGKCGLWEQRRKMWRQRFLPDGRRMAYKSLKDALRERALGDFLDTADTLVGLSVTILVDKHIKSLFEDGTGLNWQSPELAPFRHWPKHTFEKMLRIVHFIGFFIAGLSRPGQNIYWITDEDDIAANENRLRDLTKILANVSSHYITHDLGHLRCGTTKSDDGSRQLEDLASIPDLVAGVLTEIMTEQHKQGLSAGHRIINPPAKELRTKATRLMDWFATNRKSLKRLVFSIEAVPNSTQLSLKRLKFYGSNDLPSWLI